MLPSAKNEIDSLDEAPIGGYTFLPSTARINEVHLSQPSERAVEENHGFILQYYLKYNPNFFVRPYSLHQIKNSKFFIGDRPGSVNFRGNQFKVWPDLDGFFGLLSLYDTESKDPKESFDKSYTQACELLDCLSFQSDQPLSISHTLAIGMGSGTQYSPADLPAPAFDLRQSAPFSLDKRLEIAISFYREALSTDHVSHKFLSFWKSYENCLKALSDWRRVCKIQGVKDLSNVIEIAESVPIHPTIDEVYAGATFTDAADEMRKEFRNPIAHGDGIEGDVLSQLDANKLLQLRKAIPVIRYMARSKIKNADKTLSKVRL